MAVNGEESKEGKGIAPMHAARPPVRSDRMNEAEGEFHEYGYERLRPLSARARRNVKTISMGFIERRSCFRRGTSECQT